MRRLSARDRFVFCRFCATLSVSSLGLSIPTKIAEILRVQDYILECADRHDTPIVDNVSVDRSVLLVIRHVVETLRKTGEDLAEAD